MSIQTQNLAVARARQALRNSGLDHRVELFRASSTRNEVYASSEFVIRVNRQPDQRLHREAHLYASLPNSRWKPEIVAYGGQVGADYMVLRRKPGIPLAHAWPELDDDSRRSAVSGIAEILSQIHSIDAAADLPRIANTPQMLGATYPYCAPMMRGIDELERRGHLNSSLRAEALRICSLANEAFSSFNSSKLIHGDLTFENVLWDGQQITAVVDFEWCRGAPADLELDVLLRFLQMPEGHVAPELEATTFAEDYEDVAIWLAEDYPALFENPHLEDRILLYALAFEVNANLRTELPANPERAHQLHPINRLRRLIETRTYETPKTFESMSIY